MRRRALLRRMRLWATSSLVQRSAVLNCSACPCSLSAQPCRPETGECVLPGTLQDSADWCMRTEECLTFSYRPGGLGAMCHALAQRP